MQLQIDKSISDIISRFKAFRDKKIDSKSDNLLFVDSYNFNPPNYTATLARYIEARSPCLIKECFTTSEDHEKTVNIAYEIEQSLLDSDMFLWSLFINIFVRNRYKYLRRRKNMPQPDIKHYKLVPGDSDVYARYVSGLQDFLKNLNQKRKSGENHELF